jgi:hypothetical protein
MTGYRDQYKGELCSLERAELEDLNRYGVLRYEFYRHKGWDKEVAWGYALAWATNQQQQKIRRASHDTGCEQ